MSDFVETSTFVLSYILNKYKKEEGIKPEAFNVVSAVLASIIAMHDISDDMMDNLFGAIKDTVITARKMAEGVK